MAPAKPSEVNWDHAGERIDEYESMIFSNARSESRPGASPPPVIQPEQSSSFTNTPPPKIGFFGRVVNRLFRPS